MAIDSHVLGILREHRQIQLAADARSTVVFASGAGTHRRPANVRERGHAQTLADAGLPSSVRLHDLRQTAATLWLAAGASVYFVQQQLGHADLKTTIGTYGHQIRPPIAKPRNGPPPGGAPASFFARGP